MSSFKLTSTLILIPDDILLIIDILGFNDVFANVLFIDDKKMMLVMFSLE